jgi:hypothetical protein
MPRMMAKVVGACSLSVECLPVHDFNAAEEIRIDAPAPVISESLLHSDFSELWLVRFLMRI